MDYCNTKFQIFLSAAPEFTKIHEIFIEILLKILNPGQHKSLQNAARAPPWHRHHRL
jgi:hypothetical protein